MAFGIKETVGTLVGGGILMMLGLYAYSKSAQAIPTEQFTTAENNTLANVKANILSGYDVSSILFVILGIASFLGVLFVVFR